LINNQIINHINIIFVVVVVVSIEFYGCIALFIVAAAKKST
jgi:hypothetical protein